MDDNLLKARLDVLDAANEAIIKRQGILGRMIIDYQNRSDYAVQMSEALDGYIAAIDKIQKELENGKQAIKSSQNA